MRDVTSASNTVAPRAVPSPLVIPRKNTRLGEFWRLRDSSIDESMSYTLSSLFFDITLL